MKELKIRLVLLIIGSILMGIVLFWLLLLKWGQIVLLYYGREYILDFI